MSDTAIYGKIIDFLNDIIEKNNGILGYVLPSERMLAMKFNVSRNPVRRAYSTLLENGKIEKIHGKGYIIKNEQSAKFKGISTRRASRINFITPDISSVFMREIISGIESFCDKNTLDLSITASNLKASKERHLIQSAVLTNFDGIILFPVDGETYNEELIKLSISQFPITVIDRYVKNLNFTYIGTDNFAAMAEAVKFIHQKKFNRFVFITPRPYTASSVTERINGYNHGLIKYYGSAQARNLLKIPTSRPAQTENIKSYLKAYPDTELLIFTGTQFPEVMNALSQIGLSVPKDIKLMIFDDELTITEKNLLKPYLIKQDGF